MIVAHCATRSVTPAPDFAIVHRLDPTRRVLVEIVGFWTREYLVKKLADLRACGRRDIIVCFDESLQCDEGTLPEGVPVVRFSKRVRPEQVLEAMRGLSGEFRSRFVRWFTRLSYQHLRNRAGMRSPTR